MVLVWKKHLLQCKCTYNVELREKIFDLTIKKR